MPSRDEINPETDCKECGGRFRNKKILKRHLRKTRHFVRTDTAFQDSYRPERDGRNGRDRRYTTLQGPQPRHRQPSRSPGHSSSSSSGGSSTSLELNSSEYGRSRGCGSPQGRGVDNTRGSNGAINQSRNDGGPVASEQRRPPESESPPEREDSIGTPTTTTTTTTTTITPQLSDGGSVTSRMSPRHFSSSVADGDLDEVPLEDQTTRYPGST